MGIYGNILYEDTIFRERLTDLLNQNSATFQELSNKLLAKGHVSDEELINLKRELQSLLTDTQSSLEEQINEKIDSKEVYTKSQANSLFLNSNSAKNIYATIDVVNSEIQERKQKDSNLTNKVNQVDKIATKAANDIDLLLDSIEKQGQLLDLLESLRIQLQENSVAKLLARVQYLEDVLFSEEYDLIIGEIDDNQATDPPADIMNIVYDGGLVTQKEENE